jgi:hypothetical protein
MVVFSITVGTKYDIYSYYIVYGGKSRGMVVEWIVVRKKRIEGRE